MWIKRKKYEVERELSVEKAIQLQNERDVARDQRDDLRYHNELLAATVDDLRTKLSQIADILNTSTGTSE